MLTTSSCQVRAASAAKVSHNDTKIYSTTQLTHTTVTNRSIGRAFSRYQAHSKLAKVQARSICAASAQQEDSLVPCSRCTPEESSGGALLYNFLTNQIAKHIP
jgi:hypothetical protein